ncbi:MAG: hypothetical protein PHD21_08745 [Flavobacteriales bacterium]|nr:hypothetical protein [Flavobacteriales bacterium]
MKKEDKYTPDAMDTQLSELFSPLKEEITNAVESDADAFSDNVMSEIPRRDISLCVVSMATLAGVVVVYLVMGYQATLAFYYSFMDFFTSIGTMEMPTASSALSVLAVVVTLGVIGYALLNTDDYQTYNDKY